MSGEAAGACDNRGILWNPPVGLAQASVCLQLVGRVEHGRRATTEQLGAARSLRVSEAVETFDEFIVELHQDLSSRHRHMVQHMG